MPPFKLAPSILSANFARLGDDGQAAEAAGADYLHFDVMDGHFVPNITIGPLVAQALFPLTKLPLDVHLMIEAPDRFLEDFAQAGASILTVHWETCPHLHRTIQRIKQLGVRAGVSLNPATPVSVLEEILPDLDLVLLMSVNPGFGGQSYIPQSTQKIRKLREMIDATSSTAELEVDGGINTKTLPEVVAAGADVLVAGSAVFNAERSIAENLQLLRQSLA